MKKLYLLFATLFSMLLTSCGATDNIETIVHEHTFNNEKWEYDKQQHWHPSTCGHDVTSQKVNHIFSDEVVPATYEKNGYTIHTCSICGYSFNDTETVHTHVAGNPVVENRVEPTCTEAGSYELVTYCVDDNVEMSRESVNIPTLGHDLVHHDGQQATCTEAGWSAYDTCTRCDYSTYQIINATGHQHTATREENKINPTCTEDGSYDLVTYCIDDNVEISRDHKTIPALGHNLTHHEGKTPTCTENGWDEYDTCSRCDFSNMVIIPATGHQNTATKEENRVEPTCINDGSYDLVTYCIDDNVELSREQKTIPALGHDLKHHDSKAPTCTESGWDEYDTCSRCDYSNKVIVPATGHQHTATREENKINPTCTEDGSYDLVTYCTDDNAEISRAHNILPALGHDLQHHDSKDSTCTENG